MAFKKYEPKGEPEFVEKLPPPVEAYEDTEERPVIPLAETPPEWEPSKDQQAAYDGIMAWWEKRFPQVLTVGGYAGTGKTRLAGKLAYDLISADVTVAFATPTGKAAQVLKRSMQASGVLDAPVSTIHGLIYIPEDDPKTGRIIGWKRRQRLDVDLIIIDEASMVSEQMLTDLQRFGCPILAIGDHGQLPPVGEEAYLMRDPDLRLEKIHRQAKGNPIIRLSTLIRNGCPDEGLKKFIEDIDDERLIWTRARDAGKDFGKPPGMLITYTNRTRTNLNREIRHDVFGYDDEVDPQPGEVVICLKNKRLDEGQNSRLIANGARGVVKTCESGSKDCYKMTIEFDEPVGVVEDLYVSKWQFLREKTFRGFDEVPNEHTSWWSVGALFDFGYALTCHKAQGSQADDVAVFVEWALGHMEDDERRRWMYTAVTRAAEKVMLVF